MTDILNGGLVRNQHIDFDLKKKCIKISIESGYVYRKEVKEEIKKTFNLKDEDILYVYKNDRSWEWFMALKTEEIKNQILSRDVISIGERKARLEDSSRLKLTFKVHWLPVWVKDEFLTEYFSQFGEVVKVERVWSQEAKVSTEMREVTIICDDMTKEDVPHIVKFNNGAIKILITCPGRLPVCLKCNKLGHVRRDCMERQLQQQRARSYADSLKNRDFPALQVVNQVQQQTTPVQNNKQADPPLIDLEHTETTIIPETEQPEQTDKQSASTTNADDIYMDADGDESDETQGGWKSQRKSKRPKKFHNKPLPNMLDILRRKAQDKTTDTQPTPSTQLPDPEPPDSDIDIDSI